MSGVIKPALGVQLKRDHPLAQGLVACWLLNEGSGNRAYDSSGKNNIGTISGYASPPTSTDGWNPGPDGKVLLSPSDAVTRKIDISDSLSLRPGNGSMTWSFWAAPTNIVHLDVVASKRDYTVDFEQYGICFGGAASDLTLSGKKFIFFYWQGLGAVKRRGIYSTNDVVDGNWHNFVCIENATSQTLSMYMDGKLLPSTLHINEGAYPVVDNPEALCIGCLLQTGTYRYQGALSTFAIWNRALSDQEISSLYAFPYQMFQEDTFTFQDEIQRHLRVRGVLPHKNF